MILPILLIPFAQPFNILINTNQIGLLKRAFIFTDIMYSYIKVINSILGNTVVTERSERLKEALRLLRIYNNSNNSLPTLSLTLHEKINNQKNQVCLFKVIPSQCCPKGEFMRMYILPPESYYKELLIFIQDMVIEAEEKRIWIELLYISETRS